MFKIIATFTNTEDGLESIVSFNGKNYHVSLKDTDADEFVGLVLIYPEECRALAKAKEIMDTESPVEISIGI